MVQKMANMTGYGSGYTPPKGNAGSAAKGMGSHPSNPMSVPKKGSSLASMDGSSNSDRNKVMSMKNAQAMNESLRGQAGC